VEREAFWLLVVDKKYGSLVGGWYSEVVIRPWVGMPSLGFFFFFDK
jgi:hypothetical protein